MKKLILTLISILLFIYALLSCLSLRGDYVPERELWGINRTLSYLASHQESTPDYTVNQLVRRYRIFINKYHRTIYGKRAELMLGDLYMFRKNYTQARLEYQKAVCPDQELSAQAEFSIARTYELEGHWDKALVIDKSIIQNYPATDAGFYVPMYLTNHLASEDKKVYTDAAYADALAFYQRMAVQYPKSKVEYRALRMIAVCQFYQKDWSAIVKTLGEIILKYPSSGAMQEAVDTINILCVTKLHDYDMGINIYRQFIQKYPDHTADPVLKKMIESLQLLKNKKLIIQTAP